MFGCCEFGIMKDTGCYITVRKISKLGAVVGFFFFWFDFVFDPKVSCTLLN